MKAMAEESYHMSSMKADTLEFGYMFASITLVAFNSSRYLYCTKMVKSCCGYHSWYLEFVGKISNPSGYQN